MNPDPLPAVTIDPKGRHRSTVIWLHGLGADGHDFEPIVSELNLPQDLGVRFVLPHAPHRAVTINGGYVMRAWYDITGADLVVGPDAAGIHASVQSVWALTEREMARSIEPERVILAGFSQGGVIALEAAARHQDRLGGIVALSSYVALPESLPAAGHPLPIFMGHGTLDPIVPYPLGLTSRTWLEAKGYAIEWHSYPVPHSVCWDEIRDVHDWLVRHLGPA